MGFAGQAIFTARFLVQWIASERQRDSVVPTAFWWLSLAGGFTLLSYAISRRDPVIIAGQSMGVFIYVRNLMLVKKRKRRVLKRGQAAVAAQEPAASATGRPHVAVESSSSSRATTQ